jgi:hypothetical protein
VLDELESAEELAMTDDPVAAFALATTDVVLDGAPPLPPSPSSPCGDRSMITSLHAVMPSSTTPNGTRDMGG